MANFLLCRTPHFSNTWVLDYLGLLVRDFKLNCSVTVVNCQLVRFLLVGSFNLLSLTQNVCFIILKNLVYEERLRIQFNFLL